MRPWRPVSRRTAHIAVGAALPQCLPDRYSVLSPLASPLPAALWAGAMPMPSRDLRNQYTAPHP